MKRRGSKRGVKRGPYKKHKPRRYPGPKTTTAAGKREYQRNYMRDRKRLELGVDPTRFGVRGPKPRRILAREVLGSNWKSLQHFSTYQRMVDARKKRRKPR